MREGETRREKPPSDDDVTDSKKTVTRGVPRDLEGPAITPLEISGPRTGPLYGTSPGAH